MSTTTVWEAGLTCDLDGCGVEFVLGEEIMYWYGQKLHQRCAAKAASARREAAGEDQDVLGVARGFLESGSRVILTRRQLRALITLAAVDPVRKPDTGRHQWFGRMQGWSTARVRAGLSAAEVAGMWLDFLDAGRIPPLSRGDLITLIAVIDCRLIETPS